MKTVKKYSAVFLIIAVLLTLLQIQVKALDPLSRIDTYAPTIEEISEKLLEMTNGELSFEMPERKEYVEQSWLKIHIPSFISNTSIRYLEFTDFNPEYNGIMKVKIPVNILFDIGQQHETVYIALDPSSRKNFTCRILYLEGNAYKGISFGSSQYPVTLSILYDAELVADGLYPVVYRNYYESGQQKEYIYPRVWMEGGYISVQTDESFAPLSGIDIMYIKAEGFDDMHEMSNEEQEALFGLRLRGIISGTSENNFSPDTTITRAEFLTMIMRLKDWREAETRTPSFSDWDDVPEWARSAFIDAETLGIIKGDDNGNCNPNSPITKEEMYLIAYRVMREAYMFKAQQYTHLPDKNGNVIVEDAPPYLPPHYTDYQSISPWVAGEAIGMYNVGLGPAGEQFEPRAQQTRLDAATLIWRILRYDAK